MGDALAALGALHPGLRDRVVTEQGEVRPHVNVFVADVNIRDAQRPRDPGARRAARSRSCRPSAAG